ncbi:hypothetical protein FBU30_003962 [Linnemannia zychae]|nr:hypothetical protein FBU30_003962 [Linnemannia zychae]
MSIPRSNSSTTSLPETTPVELATKLTECIRIIESADNSCQLENWDTVLARRQAEDLLHKLHRFVIPPSVRIRYIMMGVYENQALYIAVKTGIAQALVDAGPDGMDIASLALKTHIDADQLSRILRVLQMSHVSIKNGDRWVAGETAVILCPGHADCTAAEVDLHGNESYTMCGFLGKHIAPDLEWPARQALPVLRQPLIPILTESRKSTPDSSVCSMGLGDSSFYAHIAAHPDRQRIFNDAMVSWSTGANDYICADYPWDIHSGQSVCDIGGADGHFLKCLLAKHPSISGGTVYDISVTPISDPVSHEPTLSPVTDTQPKVANLTFVQGDFFKAIPTGHQVYFMRYVLHNWNDTNAQRILRNVHQAMTASATNCSPVLLVAESIIDNAMQRELALLDLNMLTIQRGARERTEEEYSHLCKSVKGLKLERVWPTRGKHSILEIRLDVTGESLKEA